MNVELLLHTYLDDAASYFAKHTVGVFDALLYHNKNVCYDIVNCDFVVMESS